MKELLFGKFEGSIRSSITGEIEIEKL